MIYFFIYYFYDIYSTKVFDSDEDDEIDEDEDKDKENVEANFQSAVEGMVKAKKRQGTAMTSKRGRKVAKRG
jgi:hypothetical protein